ncbi:hypothetical protein NIES2109_48890 [Nostoc sp. HK-01]|uniref:Calcium-mediated lectin domain-containing protein n=2 Tax=Nostocales TaxID=1161 RepID=A0A1Z4GP63_9CYAN|nr:fucose-binding lectin II [Nostoc cycadae]BAY19293.1 hypothetical protein NIES21_51530 [Anabaenopsis circularis NIES-21]BBD62051.1 hypothetical protein NIES2109_48890 [Nostoc sp. HK-01]GBE95533.1 hypothetical protein NCWK1_5321 [Nostoc cycadae WK-1]
MPTANIVVNNQVAEVYFPTDSNVSATVTSHSQLTQRVTFFTDSQELYKFEGSGEKQLLGSVQNRFDSPFKIKVESQGDGNWVSSDLRTGGPYQIGSTNFLIVVAENGDDTDYNDTVIQFSWKTSY